MSLVIDADGHVEEPLADLVATIPAAMQPDAMRFVTVAGGLEAMARRELRRDPTILD
jgi:hypothetical protein